MNSLVTGDFERALQKDPQYIECGDYYLQIMRYTQRFAKGDILILIYEDIQKNPVAYLGKIFVSLGVRKDFIPTMVRQILPSESLLGGLQVPASAVADFIRNRLGMGLIIDVCTKSPFSLLSDSAFNCFKPSPSRLPRQKVTDANLVMAPRTRAKLAEIFKRENDKLAAYLGRDLGFWSEMREA